VLAWREQVVGSVWRACNKEKKFCNPCDVRVLSGLTFDVLDSLTYGVLCDATDAGAYVCKMSAVTDARGTYTDAYVYGRFLKKTVPERPWSRTIAECSVYLTFWNVSDRGRLWYVCGIFAVRLAFCTFAVRLLYVCCTFAVRLLYV
jgi:hypothetical protein